MPIKQDTDRFVKDYADRIRALREKIAALIGNLPDNSNIARLPGAGGCFAMSSRNLSMNNWSPFYYDFKAQYRKIIEIVDGASPQQIGPVIQSIIDKGSYRIGGHTWKFNPVAVSNLAEIFNGSSQN